VLCAESVTCSSVRDRDTEQQRLGQ